MKNPMKNPVINPMQSPTKSPVHPGLFEPLGQRAAATASPLAPDETSTSMISGVEPTGTSKNIFKIQEDVGAEHLHPMMSWKGKKKVPLGPSMLGYSIENRSLIPIISKNDVMISGITNLVIWYN